MSGLPDGRIAFELVHRTPYKQTESGVRRTLIDRVLYVLSATGAVEGMLSLDRAGLGHFVGVSGDGQFYFVPPREFLAPTEGLEVQQVELATAR